MGESTAGLKRISLTLDSRVYSLTAVKKAAYRLLNHFAATISCEGDNIVCFLTFTGVPSDERRSTILADFMKEVLDQDLREQVRAETEGVRNLILGYAFSKTGIGTDE